jgi:hypothetical protein
MQRDRLAAEDAHYREDQKRRSHEDRFGAADSEPGRQADQTG